MFGFVIMKKGHCNLFCYHGFLFIFSVLNLSQSFEFNCPRSIHWMLRANSQCFIADGYICLFDDNNQHFTEICRNKTVIYPQGIKCVIAGNLDCLRKCVSTRYQPLKFSTNGMSTCSFEKTYCREEGQIIFSNGSSDTDRQCRCDYTQGYDFITKPEHRCYCVPSKEDCSCYKKRCPAKLIISPDYQCINLTSLESQFTCELIKPYTKSAHRNVPLDEKDTDESNTGLVVTTRIEIFILIGVTLIVALIMALITTFCLPKIESITKENIKLKSLLTATVIPSHIRDAQTHLKEIWKTRFSLFVETRAFHLIKKSIHKEQCIIIYGPMGCGKSSTAFHIAMALEETMDYDVVIISNPDDLFKYAMEDKKQIFLIDDVFGKYSMSDYNSMWWNHHGKFVQNTLNKNKDLKLIMTSRLHIFLMVNPTQPTFCHINFTSEDLLLTFKERQMIGRCYLRDDIIDHIDQEVIMSTIFSPALCANVRAENKEQIIEHLKLPVDYISSETIIWRTSGDVFFFVLTLLLIFDNKVKKNMFNEGSHQYDEMLQFLSKEIGFDRQPSKPFLFSRFIALKRSYVLENSGYFECLHINLFNALVLSIGPSIVRTLIVYGECSFLNERTCLETSGAEYPKLTIVIPKELQDMYFERMLSDMKLGKYELYKGHQYSSVEFRKSFFTYFTKYLKAGDLKKGSHSAKVLLVVSAEGFAEYVEFFLGLEKTLVNLKDNCEQTALHKACLHGHKHVAKILLDNGASIDLADYNNETALYIACKNDKIETVKYLLSRGANIKPKICDLKSPLHVACLNGNTEIANILLENKTKVNVNDQDSNFYTALHLACANGRAKVVELLVRHKPDINLVDYKRKTAMYIAAEQGNTDIVRCLMGLSPNLDIATYRGRVALHCASKYGFEEIARLLIEQKANIDIADKNGCTPLYVACKNGQLKIVKLLLGNNAIVDISNAFKSTALFKACENDNIEIVRLLLERKADANFKNSDLMTPLHKACASDQTDIVSLLINYGALVNKPDEDLQTPLIIACLKGNYKVLDALLKVGASVNYANRTGLTPLHIACMREQKEIVQLLLDYDADIQKEATNGLTPLAIACKNGNKCIEDALLMKLHDKQKTHQVSK